MKLHHYLSHFLHHSQPHAKARRRRSEPPRRLGLEILETRLAPAAGALDLTFGTDGTGKVITDFKASGDHGDAVALQTDGKIVVVGSTSFGGGDTNFAVMRYNTDGTLDTSFDGDGKVFTDFGGAKDHATSVAIQADGKIVVAGDTGFPNFNFALARYNPDGSLDRTFDGDGRVITDFGGGPAIGFALALQADGKIVVAGLAQVGGIGGSIDFAVARYKTDGTPDSSFDVDGKLTTDFGGLNDDANGVAIQPDGKIVVVGSTDVNGIGRDQFAVARYNPDGTLDHDFNGGRVYTDLDFGDLNSHSGRAHSVALQADGKILVAGKLTTKLGDTSTTYFALTRYFPNGSQDGLFGFEGKRVQNIYPFLGGVDDATSMVVQSTGNRIVVAGSTRFGDVTDFALARYDLNGDSDVSFGTNGIVTTDFGGSDEANGMALQADGKIVVVGSTGSDIALARYVGVSTEIAVAFGATDVSSGSTVAFGNTPLGTPVDKTLTIRNPGNLSLTVSSITVPAGFQLTTPTSFPFKLASGGQTSLTVRFTGSTAGDFSGKLSISNNDSDENPFLTVVKGTVLAPTAEIQVLNGTTSVPDDTGAVNLGSVALGANTVAHTFTVRNVGNTNLTLGPSIDVPLGFVLVSGFGSTTLTPGASTTFAVGINSGNLGNFSGKVSFATNDKNENPFNFTVSGAVTVTIAAPMIRGDSLTRQVDEGGVATLRGHLVDPDPQDDLFLSIDWGDGTEPETHTVGHAPFAFEHRYLDDPSNAAADEYLVHFTWFDSGGGSNSKTLPVTVHNVAPQVAVGLPVHLRAGEALSRVGSFTDPGLDSWHATVDYGDGRGAQWLPLEPDNRFTLDHRYTQPGVYHVRVRVFDDDGGVGTAALSVTVRNVPPQLFLGGSDVLRPGEVMFHSASSRLPSLREVAIDLWQAISPNRKYKIDPNPSVNRPLTVE